MGKKRINKMFENASAKDLANVLGMLGSRKGMFSGYRLGGVGIGQKAVVLGGPVKAHGHVKPSKYARLSDGSRIVLSGKDKGLRIK